MAKLTTGWEVNEKRTNCEEQRDSNSNETRVLVSVSMYCEGNLKSYGSLPFNLSTVSRHDGTLFVFCPRNSMTEYYKETSIRFYSISN